MYPSANSASSAATMSSSLVNPVTVAYKTTGDTEVGDCGLCDEGGVPPPEEPATATTGSVAVVAAAGAAAAAAAGSPPGRVPRLLAQQPPQRPSRSPVGSPPPAAKFPWRFQALVQRVLWPVCWLPPRTKHLAAMIGWMKQRPKWRHQSR
eukprot:NODE_2405_length_1126_cov_7.311049_g1999_i0.p2 GENE.NODE_2405_length_1126_cov_7.311049_g1999_i0~~NODE_2405_length_1126_cov_7.311049_g1999_i0.p2  ORF type:complete len:150 (+),score=1.04 NODE_2405_length_1126_cov_7.311049_g1999_i0:635-1084(+)